GIVRGRSGPLPQSGLIRLEQALRDQPGFSGVAGPAEQPGSSSVRPFVTQDATAARYVLASSSDPLGPVAERNLTHLQDAMPELVRSTGLGNSDVEYSGQTALAQSA